MDEGSNEGLRGDAFDDGAGDGGAVVEGAAVGADVDDDFGGDVGPSAVDEVDQRVGLLLGMDGQTVTAGGGDASVDACWSLSVEEWEGRHRITQAVMAAMRMAAICGWEPEGADDHAVGIGSPREAAGLVLAAFGAHFDVERGGDPLGAGA